MNGVVTQYWSIIPGGIYQVLYKPITGVGRFNVLSIQECSSADWNAESGVNTLNMSQQLSCYDFQLQTIKTSYS